MELFSKSEIDKRVAELHASEWKAYIATTGACGGLLEDLWRTPNASNTILGSRFLYPTEEFDDFAPFSPESYCSKEAAAALAGAAYSRARQIAIESGGQEHFVMGVGMTAAVATGREKKGAHRVHIAVKSHARFFRVDAEFTKGHLTREEEGRVCDILTLSAIFRCAKIEPLVLSNGKLGIRSENLLSRDHGKDVISTYVSPTKLRGMRAMDMDLFQEERGFIQWPDGRIQDRPHLHPSKHLLFPGSFAPLHSGHERMAAMAERMTGKTVVFQFNGMHPDKGELKLGEAMGRAEQFLWRWPVIYLPDAGLYLEKSERFPGVGMLIGADAVYGLLNPKYYEGRGGLDICMNLLKNYGTRFYVVGREIDGKFQTLDDIPIPNKYRELFVPVSGRWDISSTELRERIR